MPNERRTARRANTQDNPNSLSLSLQLPRARITGGNAGSPITPSTPPQGSKRLNNQSQFQNTGGFTSVNFGNALPSNVTPVTANGKRTAKTTHTYYNDDDDDDTMMNNRMSLDSTTSTVTNSTVTGDSHMDRSGPHLWTDHQIAVIVRTLEEGGAPPKEFIRNGLKAATQSNPNASGSFKFLATWNPSAPAPPTTPYVLPRVPPGLIERWARELKKASDWPHDTRAIRMKLRSMAEVVAKEQGLRVSPRKQDPDIERFLGGGFSDDGDIDEEEELDDGARIMMMEYEQNRGGDDDLIISPVVELPLPKGQRNDERVYESSLNFQRNEDNINVQGWKPVHSASYNRSRSPMKPHSPSPTRSFSREATISPTNSQFSFNGSAANDISPTKSTFGITPEKKSSIGRYLSPLLPAATFTRPNRSRSISPSRGSGNASPSASKGKGKDKPHPALPLSLQTPSLSPMQLSPGSVFKTGSVRRVAATPYTVMDPSDLMASIDGGRRDELDSLAGGGFRIGKSAGRAPIPMPFFSRDMMRSKGELERREQQSQAPRLGTDPFFSAGGVEGDGELAALASTATASGSGTTPYSSISSIFSNGSMRKVLSGLSGKGSSLDLPSSGTSSRKGSTSSNSATQQPQLQQPPSIRRDDPNPIVTANKAAPIPVLPSLAQTHPHLVDTFTNGRGIKRSASFSRPPELHKRAPSYGGPAKPRPQPQQQPQQVQEVPPKTESVAQESSRPRHKRERSDSSLDLESEYDTEDVPPSSAPSSDRIPQVSPLKSAISWDSSSPSPDKMDKMYGATRKMLASPGKLLSSPKLLFGRRKVKPKTKDQGDNRSGSGSVSPSPVRNGTTSPVPEDDAMDVDTDLLQTPGQNPSIGMFFSPTDTASPMGGTTPRPRVMSTPKATLARKISTDWDVPSAGGRYASAELRSIRQSPIEERREGEPRRKRVKTDELESPPPRVQGYNTRASSASRMLSPRAMSDGPARTFYKRSAPSKTPPRRTAMPRSPRLLPGGGRTTPSRSPRSAMRLRLRSGDATPQATISQATSNTIITPDADHVRTRTGSLVTARSGANRTTAHAATGATISSASKARRPALDPASKPSASTSRSGKTASSSKPKREPSFFGAELPKPQTSGTTRFPAASTASISSVLFPGGVPESVNAQGGDEQMFNGIGSGEEGVIRAGENAAASRRADAMGKARAALRNGIGGSGRSRMTRSISMLGPGDSSRPY